MKDHSWKIGMPKTKKAMDEKVAKLDKESERLKQWGKSGKEPK